LKERRVTEDLNLPQKIELLLCEETELYEFNIRIILLQETNLNVEETASIAETVPPRRGES
jgi:hypothetical protein